MGQLFQSVLERFLDGPKTEILVEPSLLDLLMATSKAVDLLEGRPIRHGIKVAVVAGAIAKALKLNGRDIQSIVYAALLHDVGLAKITAEFASRLSSQLGEKEAFYSHALLNARIVGIPTENRFQDDAQAILNTHPQIAGHFIDRVYLSSDVKEYVAQHHELYDGSGYPLGLAKDHISLGGRILAFADVVEGVMAEVSGFTTRQSALESFLEVKAPHKFDPDVLGAFRRVLLNDLFLKQLYTLEVETLLREYCPGRVTPLSPQMLLDITRAMGQLPDGLLPGYSDQHSERVGHYAVNIAQRLEIHPVQTGELLIASFLHDLGKLAIPWRLLSRQGPLSDDEWEAIYPHPHHSQEILKSVTGFEDIAIWVGEHHERMNGRGYPASKKGFEISVGGRLIGIADVFEVLTSSRPYRLEPYEPIDALPILGQGRYRLYDSQLVSVLRSVVLETEMVFPER